jgi:DNA repair protein RadA/Sms
MAKVVDSFACSDCGGVSLKWQGQCPSCGAWNTLRAFASGAAREAVAPGVQHRLADLESMPRGRAGTGLPELDRVLGGGLVPGSVILVGGPPGIGKSTLLLQVAGYGTPERSTLYASGEESIGQLADRADRLGVKSEGAAVVASTALEEIIGAARKSSAGLLIVDSIQTISASSLQAAAGSPSQVRECAAQLIQFAKAGGTSVILVGHVTKEGTIAGPRIIEHMVDVVLYFEDEIGSRYRILRAVKNRFGAAQELGIFAMTESGLREVRNPSSIFLSREERPASGSVVTALHQGSRPMLLEVQALTDDSGGASPRRLTVGTDPNRLALLLAALHRHAGISTHREDVFVNVVGGIRITETAADLAVVAAVVSSYLSRPVSADTIVFGEVGLGGEIRPVPYGEERVREAAKLGFKTAIIPRANAPRRTVSGMTICTVTTLAAALEEFSR